MKDAFGGILNLAIISVFLVIAIGILGLTVSYTKAFRAKNIIISYIEKYASPRGCFSESGQCYEKIKNETDRIAYHPHNMTCPSSVGRRGVGPDGDFLYCIEVKDITSGNLEYVRYRVTTQVNIDIPIINKIMGLYFFQVKGDTRNIEISDYDYNYRLGY